MSKYYSIDDYNRSLATNPHNILSIMHFNIRSLHKNIDNLKVALESLNCSPDVVCLSETWLTELNQHSYILDGYIAYHVTRPGQAARGGVSCFVKDTLQSELLTELSFTNEYIELCTVKINVHNESFIISTV